MHFLSLKENFLIISKQKKETKFFTILPTSTETRELMEEVFPLTDQVNLLSSTSRYAYDSLLTSQLLSNNYGTNTNANKSSNRTNNNDTCNNVPCSPLPSKRHRESLRRQTAQGMSSSGTLIITITKKKNPSCYQTSLPNFFLLLLN